MSIPPLVCSTPPPPEQCEDDKDQEDFDINYNLSPEEDEDYDYGSFSSFNNFKPTTSDNHQELDTTQQSKDSNIKNDCTDEMNFEMKNVKKDEDSDEIILEDDVIEDLNLKIDHEPAGTTQKTNNDDAETSKLHRGLHFDIPVEKVGANITQHPNELKNLDLELGTVDNTETNITLNLNDNQTDLEEINAENSEGNINTNCDVNTVDETIYSDIDKDTLEENVYPPEHHHNVNTLQKPTENNETDEFEDFDDFQFVSSNKLEESVLDSKSVNPWQNDVSKDEDFAQFTANFGDEDNSSVNKTEINESNQTNEPVQKQHDSEDEFGDFDEFKSINDIKPAETTPEMCEDLTVLSLQSSDTEYQIIERINKVMQKIFKEEISDCDDIFESKQETSLGETWVYLRETDLRQPYIVNWNNSLAQKTLLKALCIDSRNILFGPKWSSNMPKYAANLSTAPLQPQKQTGQSGVPQNENINSDKAMNKTWTDPFAANGQESCNTERENTAIDTGPTDLDVFEAARSTKSDKIYSNTLGIQPMRQINLPDTHIFTPTNSEIPRSKTIHYDNSSVPSIILPQSVADNKMISTQTLRSESDDYWEFQDFKGTSSTKVLESTMNNELTDDNKDNTENHDVNQKSNLSLATQVLQPIKLEPIMPTLNWPDPGEVKETFDDFSDFISNSCSISETTQESIPAIVPSTNIQYTCKNNENSNPGEKELKIEKNDDDFEVFQSALPSLKNTSRPEYSNEISKSGGQASSSQEVQIEMTDFDVVFSTIEKVESKNISQNTGPLENTLKHVNNTSTLQSQPLPSPAVPMANAQVMQPTVTTKQTQMGQILQPLSLESYSQINWPNPGIDLQDLSRFNPVETLHSFKNDGNSSKTASPIHNHKNLTNNNQAPDDDVWGEFVSSKPKHQQTVSKKQTTFTDDEEWTDFVSSPSVNPQNGLNTISFNVHTNTNMQKSSNSSKYPLKSNEISLDIPSLNYITPKSNKSYNERHFQNL